MPSSSWEVFAKADPDLLERSPLDRFYPREILESERARKTFVLPAPAHGPAQSVA